MRGKVLPMNTAFTFLVGQVPSQQELADLYTSVGWSAYTNRPEAFFASDQERIQRFLQIFEMTDYRI